MSIIFLVLVIILVGTPLYIEYRKKNKVIITGQLISQNEVAVHDKIYELVYSQEFNPTKVYIRYYGELKEMLVLMYEYDTGYVLTPEDREVFKFYLIDEVHIAKNFEYIEGYIKDDKFYVTSTVD